MLPAPLVTHNRLSGCALGDGRDRGKLARPISAQFPGGFPGGVTDLLGAGTGCSVLQEGPPPQL